MRAKTMTRPCHHCGGTGVEADPLAIGKSMRELRIQRGLSLREVARRMGMSASFISDLERGNRHWGPKAATKYREAVK